MEISAFGKQWRLSRQSVFIFISSGPFLSLHLNLQAMFYRFIRGKACVVDSIVTFCDRKRQGAGA